MSRLICADEVDLVRLAFVVGIAVSLVATLVLVVACHLLVNRALASRVPIYGRNKFTLLAVISVSLIVLAHFTLLLFGVAAATGSLIGSDGLVVPALVAHHMGRQGVVRTPRTVLPAALSVVGIVLVAGLVVRAAVSASGSVPAGMTGELAFEHRLVPFAVLLSALTAWGLQVAFGRVRGRCLPGAVVLERTLVVCRAAGCVGHLRGRRTPDQPGGDPLRPAEVRRDAVVRGAAGLGLSTVVVLGGIRLLELLKALPAADLLLLLLVVVLAAGVVGVILGHVVRWKRSVAL